MTPWLCVCACAQVMAQVRNSGPVARMLFERAYAYKKGCLERGDPVGGRWGRIYDALIFSKIRAKLGGQIKFMTTGVCVRECVCVCARTRLRLVTRMREAHKCTHM